MMRALAFCLLTALPATAQDFRGLRPGMDASALGPIGEPMEIEREDGWTSATYPLPFGQALDVIYDANGVITWLNTFAFPDAMDAPRTDGLQFGHMTLADVERHIGADLADIEAPGLFSPNPDGGGFRLIYDHATDPDMLVILTFYHRNLASLVSASEDEPHLAREADFVAATLTLRSTFDPDSVSVYPGGPRTTRIPFPLPIDEAFPSLIP